VVQGGILLRWCIPRVVQGVYLPKVVYTRVYRMVYLPICLPTIPRSVHTCYMPPYYTSLDTPGTHRPTYHWVHCSTVCDVQADGTLGSRREYPLGGRLSGTSFSQMCDSC